MGHVLHNAEVILASSGVHFSIVVFLGIREVLDFRGMRDFNISPPQTTIRQMAILSRYLEILAFSNILFHVISYVFHMIYMVFE